MQLGLTYSIKKLIEENTEYDSILYYDGIKLPEEGSFVLIRPGTNIYRTLAKSKETVATDYSFDVKVYSDSLVERSKMQSELSDLMTFNDVTLYNSDGNDTNKKFEIDIKSVVPLFPEELSDESEFNQLVFEIEVTMTKNKKGRN